jgi:predicted nucleotidyltransferase
MELQEIQKTVEPILRKHNIKRAGLFGSVVRNKVSESSDVDILVELGEKISLLDFVGIKLELEDALGKKVDLVEYQSIKPLLREKILREEFAML